VLLDQDEPINVFELRRSQLHAVQEWTVTHTHTHTHDTSTEISARVECPATQQDVCTSDGWQTAAGLNQGTFSLSLDRRELIHTHALQRETRAHTHVHTPRLRQEERLC